jgi:putative transposase
MNNRDYKSFVAGEYYHVYNRGVGKMDIFKDSQDYTQFIIRLKLALGVDPKEIMELSRKDVPLRIRPIEKNSFSLVCFCLMPNHYHILIKQNSDVEVSTLISKVFTSYSMYFNKKYKRVGPIFQDSFKAVNVGNDEYLSWLSVYIHQNPSVAGLVWDLNQWKWSSYPEYLNGEGGVCEKGVVLDRYKNIIEYRKVVENSYDSEVKGQAPTDVFLD